MSGWLSKRRLDLIEMGCIAVLVAVAAMGIGRTMFRPWPSGSTAEWEPLAVKYGPGKHSQYEEEWIVRDFFRDRRGGFFVDVGANHYQKFSNTYYLEVALGWSGIAVEPQERFRADYARYRPRTRFIAMFVSDTSQEHAKLYVLERNPLVASGTREFTERWGVGTREVSVPTIRLTDLLEQSGVQRVDFLSIDVELAEPKVLAGFDIEKTKPGLVCIEGHTEVRQQILDYFARHRYVLVGAYLRVDTKNLYFVPLS